MELVDWIVWGALVATVVMTVAMAVATVLSGRPGWAWLVLYPVGMGALIGLCAGVATAADGPGVIGQTLLDSDLVGLLLAALWVIYTAAVALFATRTPRQAARPGRTGFVHR